MNFPRTTNENQQNHKKFGIKARLKIWNNLVPNSPTFFILIVVVKNNFTQFNIIFLISQMPCRTNFWILNLVEKDWSFSKEIFLWTVTINFTLQNFKTLEAALSSYQTILFYDLHIEMWSCLWMGNSSRSKFIHPRDFELWDSRDFPNFSNLYPIKCQEPCIFPILLRSIHLLQL